MKSLVIYLLFAVIFIASTAATQQGYDPGYGYYDHGAIFDVEIMIEFKKEVSEEDLEQIVDCFLHKFPFLEEDQIEVSNETESSCEHTFIVTIIIHCIPYEKAKHISNLLNELDDLKMFCPYISACVKNIEAMFFKNIECKEETSEETSEEETSEETTEETTEETSEDTKDKKLWVVIIIIKCGYHPSKNDTKNLELCLSAHFSFTHGKTNTYVEGNDITMEVKDLNEKQAKDVTNYMNGQGGVSADGSISFCLSFHTKVNSMEANAQIMDNSDGVDASVAAPLSSWICAF